MKRTFYSPPLSVATAFAITLLASSLRAEETTSTIKFSDPSKPGRMKIVVMKGDLHVQGADTTEIAVRSEGKAAAPRKDNLRVLTASHGFLLTEKDNIVTLDGVSEGARGGSADLRVTVPRNTALVIQNSVGGDITCVGLDGDIEVTATTSDVQLDDVAGGIVVGTVNGDIETNVRELRPEKPLSFQSTNGEVVLRLPTETKANVRLRTQNGAVLTDFPETALVTRLENTPRPARTWTTYSSDRVLPAEAREVIQETVRVSVQATREAADAVREGFQAARSEVDRIKSDTNRQRADQNLTGSIGVTVTDRRSPQAQWVLPTISGGKLVTGTLNSGGPEISVATVNGDITLRQREKK